MVPSSTAALVPAPFEAVCVAPRSVADPAQCLFYHSMDVPGHGPVEGQWDLRHGVDQYLGRVQFPGKRVLDVGAASGYLTFHMEKVGAQVIAFDLSPDESWDLVPFANSKHVESEEQRREVIRRLNNSFWFAHERFQSRARLVHGTVYDVPDSIGAVDVAVFGSILLHLRDPFLALQSACRLVRETVVVTDVLQRFYRPLQLLSMVRGVGRSMRFLPDWRKCAPRDSWWRLSPELVGAFLGVLGFGEQRVSYHKQSYRGRRVRLFTVVAKRRVSV
jgi:SAM-dependent methyltransferase